MDDQVDTLESVLEAFRVFDKNLNGTVSTNEFRHIMTSMGEKYTDDEFRELVQGYVYFVILSNMYYPRQRPSRPVKLSRSSIQNKTTKQVRQRRYCRVCRTR